MKALYYQCFSGISGDMNLGALVDLGVPEEHLREELAKLRLGEEFDLLIAEDRKEGITGTKAVVDLHHHHHHHHGHEHEHEHAHAGRGRERRDGNSPPPAHHGHGHRGLSAITGIIRGSGLAEAVKERSVAAFTALAEAEAHIHGMSVEEVHFHEVGATDAIVDITGAAICLDYLGVDRVYCSPVEVGSGFVDCAHGRFPVPAPATARLLRDVPLTFGTVEGESTTPTGAAILKTFVDEFRSQVRITPQRIGYGIGRRDFSIPNVLRVVLGDTVEGEGASGGKWDPERYETDVNDVIEADIDDMVPEDYGDLRNRLFESGALDVVFSPVFMKKDRPGVRITILSSPGLTAPLAEKLFASSTTLGVRIHRVDKVMLPRTLRRIETDLGGIDVKIVNRPSLDEGEGKEGFRRTWKAEYGDLLEIARGNSLSVSEARERLRSELAGKI